MKIIRPLFYLILILVGAFLLFLLYATIDDYKPVPVSAQSIEGEAKIISDSMQFKLLSWKVLPTTGIPSMPWMWMA